MYDALEYFEDSQSCLKWMVQLLESDTCKFAFADIKKGQLPRPIISAADNETDKDNKLKSLTLPNFDKPKELLPRRRTAQPKGRSTHHISKSIPKAQPQQQQQPQQRLPRESTIVLPTRTLLSKKEIAGCSFPQLSCGRLLESCDEVVLP